MRKLILTLLIFILVILQMQLWTGEGSLIKLVAIQETINRQNQENKRLYHRNRVLANEVVELQNGLLTLEEQARLELGMIKKDEAFYFIYE